MTPRAGRRPPADFYATRARRTGRTVVGETLVSGWDAVVHIPQGSAHGFIVVSDDAQLTTIHEPAGFDLPRSRRRARSQRQRRQPADASRARGTADPRDRSPRRSARSASSPAGCRKTPGMVSRSRIAPPPDASACAAKPARRRRPPAVRQGTGPRASPPPGGPCAPYAVELTSTGRGPSRYTLQAEVQLRCIFALTSMVCELVKPA